MRRGEGSNRTRKNLVSASDVGRAAYCPHYLQLKHSGAKVSASAKAARQKGNAKHDEFNQVATDKRCYVASYLYGPEDCRTERLRRFRDNYLIGSRTGRACIFCYYALSPALVSLAKRSNVVRDIVKGLVNRIVERLESRDEHN